MSRPTNRAVLAAMGLLATLVAIAAAAAQLDPNRAEDALRLNRKMNCSLEDGRTVVYWWYGTAMSRIPGERDRILFNVQGMNIRQCGSYQDEKRGPGYRSVSREVLLYLDPETNQVLRNWKNPWTGAEVEVIHVANDPVNMRSPQYAYGADGRPLKFQGTFMKDKAWTTGQAPLFYDNPLGGEYQQYVGGNYHAIEMLNSYTDAKALLDPAVKTLPWMSISWERVSDWLPWMKMGSRAGFMVFTTVGRRLDGVEQLPEPLIGEIRRSYPAYLQPPPLDDARPNETSWTYFRKQIDSRKPAGSRDGGTP